jgi:type IV pilus assembly protein PilA
VPAYQNYIIRAQVAEGLHMAGEWQNSIGEYYAANSAWPSQTDLTDMASAAGTYVSSISVTSGVITIVYGTDRTNPQIAGAILTLVPYTDANDDVVWQCGLATTPPGTIASGAAAGGTTLLPQQLPASCSGMT